MRTKLLLYLLEWYKKRLMRRYSELKVEAMKRASAFGAGTADHKFAWFQNKCEEDAHSSIIKDVDYALQIVKSTDIKSNRESITGVLFAFLIIILVILLLYLQYC